MKLSARQQRWLVGPLAFVLRTLGRTWRIRRLGFPSPGPDCQFIDALNHGDMLYLLTIFHGQSCVTMVSEHRDGQMIADVLGRFGGQVARGSSTRGGAKVLLRLLRQERDQGWIITPDGPRGPRGSVQEGVIQLAAASRRAIRPHGYASRTVKSLRTWDAFKVPYPFTRVVEFVGEPLHVPPNITRAERQEYARDLERRLAEAQAQAELVLERERRPVAVKHDRQDRDSRPEA